MKAEVFNIKCWVNQYEPQAIKTTMQSLLEKCDFEILGFMDHHFLPQGYTCIWLLGESHLAIHTYPEHRKSYVELTSCVKVKNDQFQNLLNDKYTLVESY